MVEIGGLLEAMDDIAPRSLMAEVGVHGKVLFVVWLVVGETVRVSVRPRPLVVVGGMW